MLFKRREAHHRRTVEGKFKAHEYGIPSGLQWLFFWILRTVFRAILLCCVRVRTLRALPTGVAPGFILACNHNSHLDAHVLGTLLPLKVDWLSRVEFFQNPLFALLLHLVSAIPIHRQGVPVKALRTAIRRLQSNQNIGICPEGEVRVGPSSAVYGGKIKRGAGFLAHRTGAPVIPCVILGVQDLCRVAPWLPARRGEVWVNFGAPIRARLDLPPRESRELLSREIEAQFCELARQLEEAYSLPPSAWP